MQNSDANNSTNRQAETIAGISMERRPQAATLLKPVSTNTLISEGKMKNLNFLKTCFTQCSHGNQK